MEMYLNDDDVNVDGMNQDGRKALLYVCFHENHDMAEILLDHGDDTDDRDWIGESPPLPKHFIWQ